MRIEHIKASELSTNKWAGGTTTQLAIYPKDAEYKKQNFLFRISSATVETNESKFTKLPKTSRKLMILEGEINIEHKNHHSKMIKKFEQEEFSGDWDTKSYGKATDFNLMLKGKSTGEMEAITFDTFKTISLKPDFKFYGFYIFKGEAKLSINDQYIHAHKGDFIRLVLENEIKTMDLKVISVGEVIVSKVNY